MSQQVTEKADLLPTRKRSSKKYMISKTTINHVDERLLLNLVLPEGN